MSEKDDPLFPPEWGWQRYEDATRELAAQHVVYESGLGRVSAEEGRVVLEKMSVWHMEQCGAGRLPTRHARSEKGDELQVIWRGLLQATRQAHADGQLSCGHDHEAVDLMRRPFPPQEPMPARTREPGRKRSR